jgi:hypothetical protein
VAPQNGPRVPAAAAVLLARKILAGRSGAAPAEGALPCVGLISLAELEEHLAPFGISLVRGENGVWSRGDAAVVRRAP